MNQKFISLVPGDSALIYEIEMWMGVFKVLAIENEFLILFMYGKFEGMEKSYSHHHSLLSTETFQLN